MTVTLSDWVNEELSKPSIIKHRSSERSIFLCEEYNAIAQNHCEALIIGAFHLDYIGFQELPQPITTDVIHSALLDSYGVKLVKQALEGLTLTGWLTRCELTAEATKLLLCQKSPQSLSIGRFDCEWCNSLTVALQKHHYPALKSQGGTETVSICANCHFEFHQLAFTSFYKASSALVAVFEAEKGA